MSRYEIQLYDWRCECCGYTVGPLRSHERPVGWSQEDRHDCGLTGYSKTIDLCAECSAVSSLPAADPETRETPPTTRPNVPNQHEKL